MKLNYLLCLFLLQCNVTAIGSSLDLNKTQVDMSEKNLDSGIILSNNDLAIPFCALTFTDVVCAGNDGTPCNDNNPCTTSDECINHLCVGTNKLLFCTACNTDVDCACIGYGSVYCQSNRQWIPTGKCLPTKTCEQKFGPNCDRGICIDGIICE